MHLGSLTDRSSEKLRLDPRKSWYRNLAEVTTNGDYEVTFHFSGRSRPLSHCSLPAIPSSIRAMCRRRTCASIRPAPGPFKFAEFKPNQRITVTRNRDYESRAGPISTASSLRSSATCSTAHLAFVADKLDWIATSLPLLKDIKNQAPGAICEMTPGGISRNLVLNRDAPPFDNPDMRRRWR